MNDSARMPLDDSVSLRVTRSVPVWALLTALVVFTAQGVSLQLGQTRQAELISDLAARVKEQNGLIAQRAAQTDRLLEMINETNLKAARNEYRIDDHERRINVIERPFPPDVRRK